VLWEAVLQFMCWNIVKPALGPTCGQNEPTTKWQPLEVVMQRLLLERCNKACLAQLY
jgi:hypothetical protein